MGLYTLRRSAILLCLGSLSWAPTLQAQITTGALNGIVTDMDGNPIAGARITLESPALFQPKVFNTNAKGEYRALLLPVGNYLIKVSASGKLGKVATDMRVGVGSNICLSFVLKPSPKNASATVEVISNTYTNQGDPFGRWPNYFIFDDLLPLDASFHRALSLTAGVMGTGLGTSIRGAHSAGASNQVRYAIDGMDVTDVVGPSFSRQGSQGFFLEPIPMAIEGEEVQPTPLNARYGGTLGGRVNLVTRSGSNQFDGGFQMDFCRPSWTSDGTDNASDHAIGGFQGFVSGPVIKDRLWFAMGARKQPQDALSFLQEGSDTIESILQSKDQIEGKMTGIITDTQLISLTLLAEDDKLTTQMADGNHDPKQEHRTRGWALSWNGTLRSNLSVEARITTVRLDQQRGQDSLHLNMKTYVTAIGQHEVDLGGETFQSFFRRPESQIDTKNHNGSFWINDIWTMSCRWSLLAGLRVSRFATRNTDGAADDHVLEPRFQVKWNPDCKNQQIYHASVATLASPWSSDANPDHTNTPIVTEYVLGYTKNCDHGSTKLNLVQRKYTHDSALPSSGPATGDHIYRGFELNWETQINYRTKFGGAYTLARDIEIGQSPSRNARDQIAVAYITYRHPIGKGFAGLGLLTRYTDSGEATFKRGSDPCTADLRMTTELALVRRMRLKFILQMENVFNHSKKEDPETWWGRSNTDIPNSPASASVETIGLDTPIRDEIWRNPATKGRTVANFRIGIQF